MLLVLLWETFAIALFITTAGHYRVVTITENINYRSYDIISVMKKDQYNTVFISFDWFNYYFASF